MQRYQIEFDVHYGYWYNMMCEKFYSRCDLAFNLVQLVGGSAAAAGVVASRPSLVAFSGVMLALAAAFSLAWQPGIKAERHRHAKEAWLDLKGEMHAMTDAELIVSCTKLQKQETGMTSLNLPASNAAMRSLGYRDGFVQLTPWQRLVERLAL